LDKQQAHEKELLNEQDKYEKELLNIRNMYEKHIYALQYKDQQRERDYFSFPKRDILQQLEHMSLIKSENRTLREEKFAAENTVIECRRYVQKAVEEMHEKDTIILKLTKAQEVVGRENQMLEAQLRQVHEVVKVVEREKQTLEAQLKQAHEVVKVVRREKQLLEAQVSSCCCESSDARIEDEIWENLDFPKLKCEKRSGLIMKAVKEALSPRVRHAEAVGAGGDPGEQDKELEKESSIPLFSKETNENETPMISKSILKRESSVVAFTKGRTHRRNNSWRRYLGYFGPIKKRRPPRIEINEKPILFQYDPSYPVSENDLWHPKMK